MELQAAENTSHTHTHATCPNTHTHTKKHINLQAAANAKENAKASKAKLVVAEAYADGGPILKRFRPRAQGRGFRIAKPTFHLTIRLAEN